MDGTSRYLTTFFQTALVTYFFFQSFCWQTFSMQSIALEQLDFIAVFIQGKIAFAVEVFSFI